MLKKHPIQKPCMFLLMKLISQNSVSVLKISNGYVSRPIFPFPFNETYV